MALRNSQFFERLKVFFAALRAAGKAPCLKLKVLVLSTRWIKARREDVVAGARGAAKRNFAVVSKEVLLDRTPTRGETKHEQTQSPQGLGAKRILKYVLKNRPAGPPGSREHFGYQFCSFSGPLNRISIFVSC